MTDTNQLPPLPNTSKLFEDDNNIVIGYTADQMRAYALQARTQVQGELEPYDAGLLNDFGGGNVEWWQDYIRAELGHAHDFYQSQVTTPQPAQAAQAEVTDEFLYELWDQKYRSWIGGEQFEQIARAILALRPELVPMTERELELIDGMIAVQLDHAQRCDAISNRDMAEKQKGWDMERVELLRRIRSFGITAQAKKETPCSQPSNA